MPIGMASRSYLPGDVIHKEEPFARILPRSKKDTFCEACNIRSFSLRSCKECLAVKYCDKACQKKDWKSHRSECKNMKHLLDEEGDDVVRLLGRVIHKIKDKEWKNVKRTVLGAEVSFDDIDPHYKDMTENPYLNLFYKEFKERTRTFIGAENTPSDIDMLKIIGKVIYNTYGNSDANTPGNNFFFGMTMFEHQCMPNSSFLIIENNLKVWANRKIVKSSEKISVSFHGLFNTNLLTYGEVAKKICNCSDCSLPYGESLLSKILDESKAFSVLTVTEHLLKVGNYLSAFDLESDMKNIVDDALERHSGVLGRSHILHLKLLAFRCLKIGGFAIEIVGSLRELGLTISSLFGEYSVELIRIYERLAIVYFQLGEPWKAKSYLLKAEQLKQLD